MTTRRGFLFGLGATLMVAPSIVHACNIMPVKAMDIFHKVWIEGRDLEMKPITKIIEVRDRITTGLDMAGYRRDCDLIRPEFFDVSSITWNDRFHKVDISPEVDDQIRMFRPNKREYIDTNVPVDTIPSGNREIINFVNRGRTVALDETDSYQI